MRGRYAPSPSGDLHLGNARTALIAWWHARRQDGTFVLRMEDLDPDRSKPDAALGILRDLKWLGIDWDEGPDIGGPYAPYVQSERADLYKGALKKLIDSRRVYGCTCSRSETRAEARAAASAPHGPPGGSYRYLGKCRPVAEADWQFARADALRTAAQTSGHKARERLPALRFVLPSESVTFEDEVRGAQRTDLAAVFGDFIVRRSDGVAAYHLAVAVDDVSQAMTHVVRGDDLLEATGCQIAILDALSQEAPRYAHVPLVVDPSGRRLAKRHGDLTLAALRQRGASPDAITGYLAWTAGLIERPKPATPESLIGAFSLERLRPGPAVIDPARLTDEILAL